MTRPNAERGRSSLRRAIEDAAELLEADAKARAEGRPGILVPGDLFFAVPRAEGATGEEHHRHVRELAPESVAVVESFVARGLPIPSALIEEAKLEASTNAGRTHLVKARELDEQRSRAAEARGKKARGEGTKPPVSDKVLRRAVEGCATDEDGAPRSIRAIDKLLRERGVCVKQGRIGKMLDSLKLKRAHRRRSAP